MTFGKKTIVAMNISDHVTEFLKPLKEMDFLAGSDIQFVFVFNTITYSFGLGEVPLVYPIEADRSVIEQSGLELMVKLTENVLPKNFEGKVSHKILFGDDPKAKFSRYVNEEKADLVIVPTRQKHGIFESSFAQYVNKHTTCSMILLKNRGNS